MANKIMNVVVGVCSVLGMLLGIYIIYTYPVPRTDVIDPQTGINVTVLAEETGMSVEEVFLALEDAKYNTQNPMYEIALKKAGKEAGTTAATVADAAEFIEISYNRAVSHRGADVALEEFLNKLPWSGILEI